MNPEGDRCKGPEVFPSRDQSFCGLTGIMVAMSLLIRSQLEVTCSSFCKDSTLWKNLIWFLSEE